MTSSESLGSVLLMTAAVFGLFGLLLLVTALAALWQLRAVRFMAATVCAAALLALGAASATAGMGLAGFRALMHEEVAARIIVEPKGPQRLAAVVHFPDGRETPFELAGDEIYVDAHILKWKPLASWLGVHTAYELDRVGGRYRNVDQERSAPRTVYSLARTRMVDLFELRQRHAFLAPLLDAEYGSATFVAVNRPMRLEVRVSTTGLLLRETGKP
jgi:hypothetical protein